MRLNALLLVPSKENLQDSHMFAAPSSSVPRLTLEDKAGFVRWLFDHYQSEDNVKQEFPQLEGELLGGALSQGAWGQQFWTAVETRQLSRRQQEVVAQQVEYFRTEPGLRQRYSQRLGDLPPVYRAEREREEQLNLQLALEASLQSSSYHPPPPLPPPSRLFSESLLPQSSSSSSSFSSSSSSCSSSSSSLWQAPRPPRPPPPGLFFRPPPPGGTAIGARRPSTGRPPPPPPLLSAAAAAAAAALSSGGRRRRPSTGRLGAQQPPGFLPAYRLRPLLGPVFQRVPPNSIFEFVQAVLDDNPPLHRPGSTDVTDVPDNWLSIFSTIISTELRRWFRAGPDVLVGLPDSETLRAELQVAWRTGRRRAFAERVLAHLGGGAGINLSTLVFAVRHSVSPALRTLQVPSLLGKPPLAEEKRLQGIRLFFVRPDVLPFIHETVVDGNCFFDAVRQCLGFYDPDADDRGEEKYMLPTERPEMSIANQRQFVQNYYETHLEEFAENLYVWMAQLESPVGAIEYRWLLPYRAAYDATPDKDKRAWAEQFLRVVKPFLSSVVWADNSVVGVVLLYYADVMRRDVVLHVVRNGPDYACYTLNDRGARRFPASSIRLHIFVEYQGAHYTSLYLGLPPFGMRQVFRDRGPVPRDGDLPALRGATVLS